MIDQSPLSVFPSKTAVSGLRLDSVVFQEEKVPSSIRATQWSRASHLSDADLFFPADAFESAQKGRSLYGAELVG